MKVGDYVRLVRRNITYIRKINSIYLKRMGGKNINEIIVDKPFDYRYTINDDKILKSNPNILDLIEEKDLLKIEEQRGVYTICEVEKFKEPYTNYEFLGVRLENQPVARKLYELNIKSIVTKEQFESMEYEVGEQ